jgi:pimeloyl-ACP methyl ester carboxylesterase
MTFAGKAFRLLHVSFSQHMSSVPIVYLPGAGGRSAFWRPVADRLSRQARLGEPIVFGYPGFGDVPADARIGRLEDLHDAILAVLPPRFHLVAQSMGNVLALRTAVLHPERVESLVLCAPTGGFDIQRLGGAPWREDLRAEQPGMPTWFIDDASDFSEQLASMRIPTLVIVGDADPLSPVGAGEWLRDNIPGAQLCVVPGGTHSMAEGDPDRIAELIGRFLS